VRFCPADLTHFSVSQGNLLYADSLFSFYYALKEILF
jgi:hypothetical protein